MNPTLAGIGLALQKVWAVFKTYGVWIVLAVVVVLAVVFAKNKTDQVKDLLQRQQALMQRHHQELDELQRIHDQEVLRHQQIEDTYRGTLDRINREHAQAIEQLTRAKQTELRRIIAETVDEPDKMAERVNNLFGIPIYIPPTTPNTPSS